MNQVDEYLSKLTPEQSAIATPLRAMIADHYPELSEQFKWNQPVYEQNGKGIVYFVATKAGVNFGFNRGASLNDPKGLLAGSGDIMRHIKLSSPDDIDVDYFVALIRQSLSL